MKKGYFLSDDFNPIPYRGRGLNLPQYAIGRLVERPEEMMVAIESFLQNPVLEVDSGLVVGYDFLKDQAQAIASEMSQVGLTPDTLIHDSWTANDLMTLWPNTPHDLKSINAHFGHSHHRLCQPTVKQET